MTTGIMTDVLRAFAGTPATELALFVEYLLSAVLSIIFVFLIMWLLVRVGDWVKQ